MRIRFLIRRAKIGDKLHEGLAWIYRFPTPFGLPKNW